MGLNAELPVTNFSVVLLNLGLLFVCKLARVTEHAFIFAVFL